jgi:hypothetical protein
MPAQVKTNFPEKQKEIQSYIKKLDKKFLQRAMHLALMEVSFTSVKDFMIMTSDVIEAMGKPVDADLLTVRTGRLARSVTNVPTFGDVELPTAVESLLQAKPHGTNVKPKEGEREGYKRIIIRPGKIEGIIGSDVPYAQKHEKGSGRVKARPFLEPAAKESMPSVRKIFEQTLIQTFKRERI